MNDLCAREEKLVRVVNLNSNGEKIDMWGGKEKPLAPFFLFTRSEFLE